jgi:ribosomal protein S6
MMFIFLTSLNEEAREATVAKIGEEISALGGKVHGTDAMGRQTFNRPMKGHEEGYYVRARVEMDPAQVDTLLARLKLNGDVFRVQVLRAEDSELAGVAVEAPGADPAEEEPAEKDG